MNMHLVENADFKQAAKLVHRKIGTSKRFSELEKRAIAQLLSKKLSDLQHEQAAETNELRKVLDEVRTENNAKKLSMDSMYEHLTRFAKNYRKQLTTHSHDMTTTTELLMKMQNRRDADKLQALQDCLEIVLSQISSAFTHLESLAYEMTKCQSLLCGGSSSVAQRLQKTTDRQFRPQSSMVAYNLSGNLPTTSSTNEREIGQKSKSRTVNQHLPSLSELLRLYRAKTKDQRVFRRSDRDPKDAEIQWLTKRLIELESDVADGRQLIEDTRRQLSRMDADLEKARAMATSSYVDDSSHDCSLDDDEDCEVYSTCSSSSVD